jgi:ribose-phosphate pyrophosphokinase
MNPIVFPFPDDEPMAAALLPQLSAQAGRIEWHRFPDRESLITLHGDCSNRDVILVCTLTDPDTKFLPLYFCAATARELGAKRVGLIAPYLAYMRQDRRFRDGQSLSAHSFARLLSSSFDWLVTVDPHLHRIASLDEIFTIPATAVSAMPAVSEWIAANVASPVLIGPDRESAQWAERVARSLDAPSLILEKIRAGDCDVKVSAVDTGIVRGRRPIIVDDIASSGHTLAEALRGFAPLGIVDVTCIVVHALFADGAVKMLREAGARRIVSTNTVPHATNTIDVAPSIAAQVRAYLVKTTP